MTAAMLRSSRQKQGCRIWRDASRKLGVFPSPSRGPRDACVAGWLWGGVRGGGTLANKEREERKESAPTPNPSPRSQRKHAARGGGEHGESASLFPLKFDCHVADPCRYPKNRRHRTDRAGHRQSSDRRHFPLLRLSFHRLSRPGPDSVHMG